MNNPDDIRQPTDHLPPADEREPGDAHEQRTYPDGGAPDGTSGVSPETAAEPDKPARHGVAQQPTGPR